MAPRPAESPEEAGFTLRPGTNDHHIFDGVVNQNEYRLPDDMTAWRVIDVGAHIGCFAYACLRRGAAFVDAYEADHDNALLAIRHLDRSEFHERIAVTWGAIWRSDERTPAYLAHTGYAQEPTGERLINTGGGDVLEAEPSAHPPMTPDPGRRILAIPLDAVLTLYAGEVDLLKLDCEGSEWPILYTSKRLFLAKRIIGEFHEFEGKHDRKKIPPHARIRRPPSRAWTIEGLTEFLAGRHFIVTDWLRHTEPDGSMSRLGMFFAERHETR